MDTLKPDVETLKDGRYHDADSVDARCVWSCEGALCNVSQHVQEKIDGVMCENPVCMCVIIFQDYIVTGTMYA